MRVHRPPWAGPGPARRKPSTHDDRGRPHRVPWSCLPTLHDGANLQRNACMRVPQQSQAVFLRGHDMMCTLQRARHIVDMPCLWRTARQPAGSPPGGASQGVRASANCPCAASYCTAVVIYSAAFELPSQAVHAVHAAHALQLMRAPLTGGTASASETAHAGRGPTPHGQKRASAGRYQNSRVPGLAFCSVRPQATTATTSTATSYRSCVPRYCSCRPSLSTEPCRMPRN